VTPCAIGGDGYTIRWLLGDFVRFRVGIPHIFDVFQILITADAAAWPGLKSRRVKKMTTSPRWRTALAVAGSAAVLVAAPLVGMPTAHADPYPPTPCPAYPPQPPHVKVYPKKVRAGGILKFVGTCFFPDQKVIAELHSHEVVLGKFRADDNGTVKGSVEIPKRTKPGKHVFELEGKDPRLEAFAEITVTRKDGHHHGDHDGDDKGDHDNDHKGDHRGDHDGDHRGDHKEHGEHDRHRTSLAKTGNEKALALGGTAAGLLAGGTGAMMAVRRRRNS
jgi:hypothetical protein